MNTSPIALLALSTVSANPGLTIIEDKSVATMTYQDAVDYCARNERTGRLCTADEYASQFCASDDRGQNMGCREGSWAPISDQVGDYVHIGGNCHAGAVSSCYTYSSLKRLHERTGHARITAPWAKLRYSFDFKSKICCTAAESPILQQPELPNRSTGTAAATSTKDNATVTATAIKKTASQTSLGSKSPVWVRVRDVSGRVYFYCKKTRAVSWTLPDGAREATLEELVKSKAQTEQHTGMWEERGQGSSVVSREDTSTLTVEDVIDAAEMGNAELLANEAGQMQIANNTGMPLLLTNGETRPPSRQRNTNAGAELRLRQILKDGIRNQKKLLGAPPAASLRSLTEDDYFDL